MTRGLIVPAAGLGTRLRSDLPKALTPVAGRPMISHVLSRFERWCDFVTIVSHPSARGAMEELAASAPRPTAVVEQPQPTGMLDAILLAAETVRGWTPDRVWICWCDQVLLSAETVQRIADREAHSPAPAGVVPTAHVPDPYIHFDRDATGTLVRVRHRREGDAMPDQGETDAGVFALSADAYLTQLPAFAGNPALGMATGERNFLPFLPWLAARATVVTVEVFDPIEVRGINTPEDLALAAQRLHAPGSKR